MHADDFMPVDISAVRARSGDTEDSLRNDIEPVERRSEDPEMLKERADDDATAQFGMSGAKLKRGSLDAVEAPAQKEMSVREKMVANGYSAEMINNVMNASSVFSLPHLMHSNAAGFAADLQQTRPDALNRALATSVNMSTASDQPIVDAINGKIEPTPEMRAGCSMASAICAGVPHNMLEMRFAAVRGCNWYKNLYATYKAAVDVGAGMKGKASPAVLAHAAANNCDETFVNWVAANVDCDESLTQVSMNSAAVAAPNAASANVQQLAWGPLDALASNLKVDGLSPVAVASLRAASTPAEHLMMNGDAASVANTLSAIKQHWDSHMADLYVSSSDSFLGVRRNQAKAASFAHFLSNNVFSKNDTAASAAAGPHADSAVSASLNHVDAQGASVWNNLVSAVSGKTSWPTAASVPDTINQWKLAAAGASSMAGDSNETKALPLAFRASAAIPKAQQVQSIASASAKPVLYSEDDAWAAISFPFSGVISNQSTVTSIRAAFREFLTEQNLDAGQILGYLRSFDNPGGDAGEIMPLLEVLEQFRVFKNESSSPIESAQNIRAVIAAIRAGTMTWPSNNTQKQDVKHRYEKYLDKLGIDNAPAYSDFVTTPSQFVKALYVQVTNKLFNANTPDLTKFGTFAELLSIIFTLDDFEIRIQGRPKDMIGSGYKNIKPYDSDGKSLADPSEFPRGGDGRIQNLGLPNIRERGGRETQPNQDPSEKPTGGWYLIERPFKVCDIF